MMFRLLANSVFGMSYVNLPNLTAEKIRTSSFEIEIARKRFTAEACLQVFYDPTGAKMRS